MKFIHVTDLHIMGRTPKYRKDDFLQTILGKMKKVQDYAHSIGATGILCTGDFFDRADTAYSVLNEVIPVLRESKVPWYTIIGNHDEYGYNPDTIDRTPLGTLFNMGLLNRVTYEKPVIFHPNFARVDGVVITGCDSTALTDNREDKEYDYGVIDGKTLCPTIGRDEHVTTIHLSHGFLADKNWGDKIHHTQIKEVYDKVKADIILCGHEHSGFGIVTTANGKIFVNNGALGRITVGVGDINRTVAITEITIENGETYAKTVAIDCADAEEAIDIELAMQEKERTKILATFSENTRAIDTEQISLNPFEAIDAIIADMQSSEDIDKSELDIISSLAKEALRKAYEETGINM